MATRKYLRDAYDTSLRGVCWHPQKSFFSYWYSWNGRRCAKISWGKVLVQSEGHTFALKVGDFIKGQLVLFQKETGNLYSYEATPAESTCYRLAKKDKKKYPDIYVQGEGDHIYYTNSCHQPVYMVKSINENFKHQNALQKQFTGGTVIHNYLEGAISGDQAKELIRALCTNYEVPYISLSPISRYCESHGYVSERVDNCPICNTPVKKISAHYWLLKVYR